MPPADAGGVFSVSKNPLPEERVPRRGGCGGIKGGAFRLLAPQQSKIKDFCQLLPEEKPLYLLVFVSPMGA